MISNLEERNNFSTLVIHSTDNSFGFGFRKNNDIKTDKLFIKKFDNDLCNNLVVEFDKFISKENLQKVNKISVSTGPANFNASRIIVVLARTISQQLKFPLESHSSFEIIAKRIALKNNILKKNQSFWIYKKLKRKGFIAGKYAIIQNKKTDRELVIHETVLPKLIKRLESKEIFFEANYKDEEDLTELLDLSNRNLLNINPSSWQKVLPLYPMSPIN